MSIILGQYEDEMVDDYERPVRKWAKKRSQEKKS